jgi:hypothetical protein
LLISGADLMRDSITVDETNALSYIRDVEMNLDNCAPIIIADGFIEIAQLRIKW